MAKAAEKRLLLFYWYNICERQVGKMAKKNPDFCDVCGCPILDDDQEYCDNCGSEIEKEDVPDSKSSSGIGFVYLILFIVLIVILFSTKN